MNWLIRKVSQNDQIDKNLTKMMTKLNTKRKWHVECTVQKR